MNNEINLVEREGSRPATSDTNPHQQLEQNAPEELQEELFEKARALEGVTIGETGVPELGGEGAVTGTRAYILDESLAKGPRSAFLVGMEFGHQHPDYDGSLHLCLPDDVREEALEKGWGELHPLAGTTVGGMHVTEADTLVFGPRTEELETVWQLVRASYDFARGQES